jgi:NodT family efflux transporter outer membrane factor (OMF) lipoprotein
MRPLLLFLLLTGCHVFAPAPAPQPTLPPAYRVQPGDHAVPEAWWRELGSPELDALMDEAFRSAPDVRTARARLEQARAAAARTGSALWPTVTADGDAAHNWSKAKQRNVAEADLYGLGLAASYELDLWGRVRSLRAADTLVAEAGLEDLRTAAISLSGEIAAAWVSLCSAREQLAVLDAQQRTNADIESTLSLRFANSLASALDILQQREAMAENTTRIIAVQAETARLENRLHLLLGKAPGSLDLSAATRLPQALNLPDAGLPADLLRDRPDIRASWRRLQEAGWDVAAARADRMPALRLTGRFEQTGDDVQRIFDNWLASLAASLTAPLFDGGSRAAEVERQQAIRAERLAQYEKAVFTALSEVDTGISDVLKQSDLITALDLQLEAARSALQSARVRYQNGVLEYDTVLSLLLKVQGLERGRIQAKASLLTSQTGLCRALGRGWRQAFPDRPTTPEPEAS